MSIHCYSQHTEKFNNITSNLKPSDSLTVDLKFSNGKQKEIGKIYEYEFNDYVYSFYYGKQIEYYRDGSLAYENEYNDYGILLSCKWYVGSNNLLRESETLKIDSNAKNVKEFFEKEKHLTITTKEKIYRYDNKKCEYYLKKEGLRINGKKTGLWKIYEKDGSTKKEEMY